MFLQQVPYVLLIVFVYLTTPLLCGKQMSICSMHTYIRTRAPARSYNQPLFQGEEGHYFHIYVCVY